jgi:hypothetical protein
MTAAATMIAAATSKRGRRSAARPCIGSSSALINHPSVKLAQDKFIIVDFNDQQPIVFTGSSNLAAGGERENGDNLLAVRDPTVAAIYAFESLRLIGHYRFREASARSNNRRSATA